MSDPRPRLRLKIFLSSPGDVAEERAVALKLFERIQYDPLLEDRVTIRAVAWDKEGDNTPLLATMPPQEAIDLGFPRPSECDIVIVIFWARMGTPLPPDKYQKPDGSPYLSGTEWEYEDAVQAAYRTGRPKVVVYRRTEDPPFGPKSDHFAEKLTQWQRVEAFFKAFSNEQGYNVYETPEDFREKLEDHLRKLIALLLKEAEVQTTAPGRRAGGLAEAAEKEAAPEELPPWPDSPFPGLRAFTGAEAPIFFGRGREIDGLVRLLRDPKCRMVAVMGSSGSGKSSLVAAGLVPRLQAGAVPGSRHWLTTRFTPGEAADGDPHAALLLALRRAVPGLADDSTPVAAQAEHLRREPALLQTLVETGLKTRQPWSELVLYIDQFEEAFTLVKTPHLEPFIELLAYAVTIPRLRLILTLRTDFHQRCQEYPKLGGLLRTATFSLAQPDRHALEEMIKGPAARARLTLEDGLVEKILDETGTQPGSLALMAYALDELYEASYQTRRLTHRAYDGFKGVQGAIGVRADSIFETLSTGAQQALPAVFRQLVKLDEQGVATRNRAPLGLFEDQPAARELIEALTHARLLTQDRDQYKQPIVEVAHEALFSSWRRLKQWLDDDRQYLLWRHRLQNDAASWQQAGRDRSYLHTGRKLAESNDFSRLNPGELSAGEQEFLRASNRAALRKRLLIRALLAIPVLLALYTLGNWGYKEYLRRHAMGPMVHYASSRAWLGNGNTRQRVQVAAFAIDKHEVTYAQYRLCVRAGRCSRPLDEYGRPGFEDAPAAWPVTRITAYQAATFCQWLGRRLPTTAEWERAARGTDGRLWPWGDEPPTSEQAHLSADTPQVEQPVAVDDPRYAEGSTPDGLMHLVGNVEEWTATPANECRANPYTCTQIWDGKAPVEALHVRGFSFFNTLSPNTSISDFVETQPNIAFVNIGFRCARD